MEFSCICNYMQYNQIFDLRIKYSFFKKLQKQNYPIRKRNILTRPYIVKYTTLMNATALTLESDLLLRKGVEEFLSPKIVQLLENITIYGSISKAAKASGVTYKTAWAWIEKINTLTPTPMVQRISGGKGGGGTVITAYAKELICRYLEVQALHQKHLTNLEKAFDQLSTKVKDESVFSRLDAQIKKISYYDDKATVLLALLDDQIISAKVAKAFLEVKALDIGSYVSVLIESDTVSVSKSFEKELSSQNKLKTKVKDIMIHGQDVLLELSLGMHESISSQITYKSYQDLTIKKDDEILAIFKTYSITLLERGI